MATLDLGMPENMCDSMRLARRKLESMMCCGSCEFRYHYDGGIHCAQGHDKTADFAGNVCDGYVFINDWDVRK